MDLSEEGTVLFHSEAVQNRHPGGGSRF
jgi:hypothetical protein